MNPLMNLYMRQMAQRGGRMGGAAPGAGTSVGQGGLGPGPSNGKGGGFDASQPDFGQENVGPPDADKDDSDQKGGLKSLFTNVVKNVFTPENFTKLGLMSINPAFGVLNTVSAIANAFGIPTGPAPDPGPDRAGGPQQPIAMTPTDTTVPVNPGDPFAGDAIRTQRYKDFMLAGYPPDMAEYLVNQLM